MAAKKDQKLLFIIVSVVVLFLLYQQGFLGAIVKTCETQEPNNIFDMLDIVTDGYNGTAELTAVTTVQHPDGLKELNTYHTVSALGVLDIIDVATLSCDEMLGILNEQYSTSYFVNLGTNESRLLYADGNYWWCNSNDNLGMRTSDPLIYSKYDDGFEICRFDYVDDPVNETASFEEETDILTTTDTGTSTYTAPAEESSGLTQKLIMVFAVLFIIYYVMFERGPKKGLVKGHPFKKMFKRK